MVPGRCRLFLPACWGAFVLAVSGVSSPLTSVCPCLVSFWDPLSTRPFQPVAVDLRRVRPRGHWARQPHLRGLRAGTLSEGSDRGHSGPETWDTWFGQFFGF